MKFTQHYTGAPVCAPARCVLLTGQHSGHAYIRGNDEWGERGKVWDYQAMFDNPILEGQRPLPDSIVTIAEILQSVGYTTGGVGKWGLGAPETEGVPIKQGFDYFFGYNCQRQAHTYYPMHLWENEDKVVLNNKFVPLHANLVEGADPNDSMSYSDFRLEDYAPELMHEKAKQFILENRDRPFFFYYASPIPHLPLQVPQEWVNYYRSKLGAEEPFTGNSYFPCQYPRATYAGMISYLDQQVGDLVSTLKELGIYDNTLIIFTSDNGPTYTGGADTRYFESAQPFKTEYGRGKGFVYEGGIRVPMIASWPNVIKPGTISDHISAFYDVMPTLCDISGAEIPDNCDGISFLPSLMDSSQQEHEYLFWDFPEYGGQQAVRMGKWKGIRKNTRNGNLDIELYDLQNDIQEQNNIASSNPEVVEKIADIMVNARTEPLIDRFKIEPLGDVKNAYKEAVIRMGNIMEDYRQVEVGDGYFNISRSTKYRLADGADQALTTLQSRLKHTGGYELNEVEDQTQNLILFEFNEDLERGKFELHILPERITIIASGRIGYYNGVNAMISLMDDKINVDFEMHNPVWIVSSGTINS